MNKIVCITIETGKVLIPVRESQPIVLPHNTPCLILKGRWYLVFSKKHQFAASKFKNPLGGTK